MPDETVLIAAELTEEIIGGFYRAYHKLGFGFSEAIYSNALAVEFGRRGLHVEREVGVDIVYEGVDVGRYRLDMVVEGVVVVEIKATKALTDADRGQLLSYLRATALEVGLLLHFGPTPTFKRLALSNVRKSQVRR